MSNRQLQLQVIIKNHQSKIFILKEENKLLVNQYEDRLIGQQDQFCRIIAEKDKIIEHLTIQLEKDKEVLEYQQLIFDNQNTKERQDLFRQLEKYKTKCFELQRRIQSITEKYQMKHKQLESQNSKLKEAQDLSNTSRYSMLTQIDKLNRFYNSSRSELPRRNQTLEWTDKLTNFIAKFQAENAKGAKQAISYLKGAFDSLKTDIIAPIKQAVDHEQIIIKQRKIVLSKIHQIIEDQNKINKQFVQDNDRFWELAKKQKQTQESQRLVQLQKQLTTSRQKHQQEYQQLTSRIKQLENQRKTLMLGFTELKTLNQAREKTYRDQITTLKLSIEELLTGIEERQASYQNQTQALHTQLTSINQRYYENIEIPLQKLASKLQLQVKVARLELQKLAQNKGFIKLLQNLEVTLQDYVQQHGVSAQLSYQLTQYNKRTGELIDIGRQMIQQETNRQLFEGDPSSRSMTQQKEITLHNNIDRIEWKQRQNKLNYEINTLKKHNKKLKDLCTSHQNKIKNERALSPIRREPTKKPSNVQESLLNARIIELETEIEQLRGLNNSYQDEFMYQIKLVREALHQSIGQEPKLAYNLQILKQGMVSIDLFNQKLNNFLTRQNTHIKCVSQTLASLDRMLIHPVQVFDNFINKITDWNLPFTPRNIITSSPISSHSLNLQRLQSAYGEFICRRQDNIGSVNRLVTQLIKTLRETQPIISKTKIPQPQQNNDKQHQKLDKSRVGRETIDKKIKQVQNQRIKNRQELVRKIEKIEESLRLLDHKAGKRITPNPARLEELLDKKIAEITERFIVKNSDSKNELGQITTAALKDLKTKLKSCMTENEGLIKEIECFNSIKKENE